MICSKETPLHQMDATYCSGCGSQVNDSGHPVTPDVPTLLQHVEDLQRELSDVKEKAWMHDTLCK